MNLFLCLALLPAVVGAFSDELLKYTDVLRNFTVFDYSTYFRMRLYVAPTSNKTLEVYHACTTYFCQQKPDKKCHENCLEFGKSELPPEFVARFAMLNVGYPTATKTAMQCVDAFATVIARTSTLEELCAFAVAQPDNEKFQYELAIFASLVTPVELALYQSKQVAAAQAAAQRG